MSPMEKHDLIMFRLDELRDGQKMLFKILEGNGSGGLTERLTKVEGTVTNQEGRWRLIFGIIAAIVVAIIVTFVKG